MKLDKFRKCFLLLFLASSCGVKPTLSPREKFRKAVEYYNNRDYSDAIVLFKEILIPLLGTNEEIEIRYYVAKSYFNKEQYLRAADAFADFFDTFPASDRAEEALYSAFISLFKEAPYSNLDQSITHRAIEAIDLYLKEFPGGKFANEAKTLQKDLKNRIEEKDFDNLKVFFDMKNYLSAVVYCNNFEKDHPGSSLLAEVLFMKINSLYSLVTSKAIDTEKKFLIELVNASLNFIEKYPHDKNIAFVNSRYNDIITQGGVH